MSGLIHEIQSDALNQDVRIENLLRRVKLAAAKLQLNSLSKWVENELSGYPGEIPEYRRVQGQPAAWNPYNGWIPVFCDDHRLAEMITEARIAQSVSSLRDPVDGPTESGRLHFPIPAGLVAELNKLMNFQTARMVIQISRGHVVGILDEVRTKVLDWAIEMEKNGVTGNDLTFSKAERVGANAAMPNINIGSIGNFAENMGSGNSAQDIAATSLDVADVANLSAQLNSELEALVAAGADREALAGAIQSIQEEVDSGLSDKKRFKTVLSNTKDVLVGAGGNLTAQGAISAISKLLESLG